MTIDTLASDRINLRRLIAFLAMFRCSCAFLDIQVVSASLTEIQAWASPPGGRNLVGADVPT
jgi:hypothetical protein